MVESSNDWEGGRGDSTIPPTGISPEHPLQGTGLHDPLHGRQACSESNSLHKGVGQICPREKLFSGGPPLRRKQICNIPPLPASVNINDSTRPVIPRERSVTISEQRAKRDHQRAKSLALQVKVNEHFSLQNYFLSVISSAESFLFCFSC